MKVVADVAKRYNIDGVHMDDYFYPYAIADSNGKIVPFPDSAAYRRYVHRHGKISIGDWRRQNINTFIKKLDKKVHQVNPDVRFGISPFGIWRPGHPPQIKGYDAYAMIYADSRKWLRKGWVDYLSPQLYWPIEQKAQSFPVLLKWWKKQNVWGRHLWPGLYTSGVMSSWKPEEIINQIKIIRKNEGGSAGEIHFSMQALMKNPKEIDDKLKSTVYSHPALVPETYWLPHTKPLQPDASVHKKGNRLLVKFKPANNQDPWLWVVKVKYGEQWDVKILSGYQRDISLSVKDKYGVFGGAIVSMVDSLSIESAGQMLLPVMAGL